MFRTIRFYFDGIPHNAHLAWMQLPPLALDGCDTMHRWLELRAR